MVVVEQEYADGGGLALVISETMLPLRPGHPSALLVEASLRAWNTARAALESTPTVAGEFCRILVASPRAVLGIARVKPSGAWLEEGPGAFVFSQTLVARPGIELRPGSAWNDFRAAAIEAEMDGCRRLGWSVLQGALALAQSPCGRGGLSELPSSAPDGSFVFQSHPRAAAITAFWRALEEFSSELGHGMPVAAQIETDSSQAHLDFFRNPRPYLALTFPLGDRPPEFVLLEATASNLAPFDKASSL